VLAPAVQAANSRLAEDGIAPIGPVAFHSLRRTFAALRCACGDDVRYVSDQLGYEDPTFTLKVYAKATRRRERLAGPHLAAYDAALEWAAMGSNGLQALPEAAPERPETRPEQAVLAR
jgi:integrase